MMRGVLNQATCLWKAAEMEVTFKCNRARTGSISYLVALINTWPLPDVGVFVKERYFKAAPIEA